MERSGYAARVAPGLVNLVPFITANFPESLTPEPLRHIA